MLLLSFCLCTRLCFANPVRWEVPSDSGLWWKSYSILQSQIGIREKTGHNDGPEIKMYLKSVGLAEGYAWCAALQVWTFVKAACEAMSSIPIAITAMASGIYTAATISGRKSVNQSVHVGDIVVWKFSRTPSGHTGRCTKVLYRWRIRNLEGNTSSGLGGSQRDGGGVYERTRDLDDDLGGMDVRGYVGCYYK